MPALAGLCVVSAEYLSASSTGKEWSSFMTAAPKISIIVPVYNVASYVGECLSSLVHQTFTDFEVIAVNDGSTDGSLAVLREFEQSFPFVHVIDQPNSGVSPARMAGLAMARGEYISFVDGDDYVVPNFLEKLYTTALENDADIVCCNYYFRFESTGLTITYPWCWKSVLNRDKAMQRLIRDYSIQGFLWNKLYRKTLFTEHDIPFPAMCFEDMIMNRSLFSYANKVVTLRVPLYYYQQRPTSALNTMTPKKINDFFRMLVMTRKFLENIGEYDKFQFSYRILCGKTAFCSLYYILKMHMDHHQAAGFLTNLKKVSKSVRLFIGNDFDSLSEVSVDVVDAPRAETNYSH